MFIIVLQVSFTPNGVDMRMLHPCDAPLRRHFLPGVKVEYSVSPRQSAYRVQIHRIQVNRTHYKPLNPLRSSMSVLSKWLPQHLFITASWVPFIFTSFNYKSFLPTDPESAARSHLPLCFLPCKTAKIYHHGRRSVNPPVEFSIMCCLYAVVQSVIWFYFSCRTQTSNWHQHRYQSSRTLWHLSNQVIVFLFNSSPPPVPHHCLCLVMHCAVLMLYFPSDIWCYTLILILIWFTIIPCP